MIGVVRRRKIGEEIEAETAEARVCNATLICLVKRYVTKGQTKVL